jgi:hypothetical protein
VRRMSTAACSISCRGVALTELKRAKRFKKKTSQQHP